MSTDLAAPTLEGCERIIERAQARFAREARTALLAIHDGRLYRDSYTSFEMYLLERWGISRASGYRMLEDARAIGTGNEKPQVSVSHPETITSSDLPNSTIEAAATPIPNASLLVGREDDVITVAAPTPRAVPAAGPTGESSAPITSGTGEALGQVSATTPQEPPATVDAQIVAAVQFLNRQPISRAAKALALSDARDHEDWARRVARSSIHLSAERRAATAIHPDSIQSVGGRQRPSDRDVTPMFKGAKR